MRLVPVLTFGDASSRPGLLPVALSLDAAKRAEARLIQELVKSGASLANVCVFDGGKSGVVNHYPPGSFEYAAVHRDANRGRLASDSEFRNRRIAKNALWELRRGRPVTARRGEVITLAGCAADALTILRSQNRESEWPGGTAV